MDEVGSEVLLHSSIAEISEPSRVDRLFSDPHRCSKLLAIHGMPRGVVLRGRRDESVAIDVLFQELGIVNTVRFLNQFTTGYGDYTQEREALFKDLTLDEILSALKSVPGQQNA